MDLENKTEFFFDQLESIITDPTCKTMDKIQALKVYGSILPTVSKNDITITQEVATLDTSKLSNDEKIKLMGLLDKIDE